MKIEINHISIFYKLINTKTLNEQKPFIIFLHEGLGSVEQWFGFDEQLCKELDLPGMAYDRNGFGKSSELKQERKEDYLYTDAKLLNNLLKKLKIKTPIIIFGHSDGGTLGLLYSALYPQNVSAVISEAHHVIIEQITIKGMKDAIYAYQNEKLKIALEKFHPNKVDSMFWAWANMSLQTEALKFSLVHELKKITVPVFAFQGENDQYGSEKQLLLIKENCSDATTLLIENCSHYAHREKTEIVISEIKKFLKLKLNMT